MDETVEIDKPFFRGTKGPEFERICEKVEKQFLDHLSLVKSISCKIFDVKQPTWHDDMFIFRVKMRDLEVLIENLINTVFSDVTTIEAGIYSLYGLYNYINRENLKSIFDAKTTFVRCDLIIELKMN